MSDETLISYAQNGEDVVLWRALGHVHGGVYVDVGGWDPDSDSVTRLFYERGWRGIDVEPVPDFADAFRRRRPLDEVAQCVITDDDTDSVTFHRIGETGLSTMDDELAERHRSEGFDIEDISVPARRLDDVLEQSTLVQGDIHFLKIDVEGAEDRVLRSFALDRWRPWVLVVEATEPNSTVTTHGSWEPDVLDAGYTFTLFDGLSRFYASPDHPELIEKLSYPACVLDDAVPVRVHEQDAQVGLLTTELEAARRDALRWRRETVSYWASAVAKVQLGEADVRLAQADAERLRGKVQRIRQDLQTTRADRKRLRARVGRLQSRIHVLEQRPATTAVRARQRLGAAVAKVRRA